MKEVTYQIISAIYVSHYAGHNNAKGLFICFYVEVFTMSLGILILTGPNDVIN